MDNGSLVGQKYSHGECVHGECVNHHPEWEKVGEERSEPILGKDWLGRFKKETYWNTQCCGKPMKKLIRLQRVRCTKCGQQKDHCGSARLGTYVGLCSCCGRTEYSYFPNGDAFLK